MLYEIQYVGCFEIPRTGGLKYNRSKWRPVFRWWNPLTWKQTWKNVDTYMDGTPIHVARS